MGFIQPLDHVAGCQLSLHVQLNLHVIKHACNYTLFTHVSTLLNSLGPSVSNLVGFIRIRM